VTDIMLYLVIGSIVAVAFYATKRAFDIISKQSEFIMVTQNEHADEIIHSRQLQAEKNFKKIQESNKISNEKIWDSAMLRGDITDDEMKRLGISVE